MSRNCGRRASSTSSRCSTCRSAALGGQFYYEGVYDLADDEALIVASPVPKVCTYRSLILTNELYETTDWINNHASLNAAQAAPDADGKLRIVVSAKDPGVKNWLDTSGYPRGVIQGRWTGCDSQPIPEVQKVKVKDVLSAMPSGVATVTPAERQAILRERRARLSGAAVLGEYPVQTIGSGPILAVWVHFRDESGLLDREAGWQRSAARSWLGEAPATRREFERRHDERHDKVGEAARGQIDGKPGADHQNVVNGVIARADPDRAHVRVTRWIAEQTSAPPRRSPPARADQCRSS